MADEPGGYRVVAVRPAALDQLADAWRRLERGPEMTAFQSFDWARLANDDVRRERLARLAVRTRYFLVERAGAPVLIAPLRVHLADLSPDHRRGVHLVGRNGPADYLNFVYDTFDPDAAAAALSAASRDFGVRWIRLERLLTGTATYEWALGTGGAREHRGSAVALRLPADEDAYRGLLSKSTRQNLRTAWNRARADGVPMDVTILRDVPADLADELAELKRRRDSHRLTRQRSARQRLLATARGAYHALLFTPSTVARRAMTAAREPWVLCVRADGRIGAFAFGLTDDFAGLRTLRLLQVGIDEAFARYSPGLAGLHRMITEELATGRANWDVIDFTRGEEPYKAQLGGRPHEYTTVEFELPAR